MKLIVILLCLAVERYVHIGDTLERFSWYGKFVALLKSKIKVNSLWTGYQGVAFVLLPFLIVFALIYCLLVGLLHGMVELIGSSHWNRDCQTFESKRQCEIYVWELDGIYDEAYVEWPRFQHDLQYSGWYNFN